MQLALPSRDYYLKSSSEGDMEAYHTYMTNVAVLLGADKATAREDLRSVVEFERQLANVCTHTWNLLKGDDTRDVLLNQDLSNLEKAFAH